MALVPALICSPVSAMMAMREPMKTWIRSFGEVIAVAAAKAKG